MYYVVEFEENKMNELLENTEKALKYMGKVMQCIGEMDDLKQEPGSMNNRMNTRYREDYSYGERSNSRMNNRGRYSDY